MPPDGSTAVARTAGLGLTLNANADASSYSGANSSTVELVTPEGVLVPSAVTGSGTTISIAPVNTIAGATTYAIKASTALKDVAGDSLASAYASSFTTARSNFAQTGDSIGNLYSTNHYRPFVATDDLGNVFSIWTDSDGAMPTGYVAYQFYYTVAQQWVPGGNGMGITSSVVGTPAQVLSLTSVPGGEPVAIISLTLNDGNTVIQQITFGLTTVAPTAGNPTYQVPTITPLVADVPGNSPATGAAVYANGVLTVANINNGVLKVAAFNPVNQTWGAVQQIDGNATALGQGVSSVALAADSRGNVTLAWIDNGHVLAATQAASASTFGASHTIDALATGTIGSVIAAGGSNGTVIAWDQTANGGVSTVQAAHLTLGGSAFSNPTQLDDGQSPTGAAVPAITVDKAGIFSVIYSQNSSGPTPASTDGMYLSRLAPGASAWDATLRATGTGQGGTIHAASIAADGAGNVVFTYLGHATTYGQYLVSTKTFQQNVEFDAPTQTGVWGDPNFVFDRNNNGTAVYFYSGSAGNQVHADRFQ